MTDLLERPVTDFDRWRADNAPALATITHLALCAAQRGATRLSIKSLFEAAREAGAFGDTEGEPVRLDNSRTAEVARWLMERYPVTLGGKFKTRRRRTERSQHV